MSPASRAPAETVAAAPAQPVRLALTADQLGWVLGVAVLFAYAIAVVVPYAVGKDYAYLAASGRTLRQLDRTLVSEGRPLAAALNHAAFRVVGSLSDLRYLRLFGVLGLAAMAILLQRSFRRAGWPLVLATLAPFWIVMAPPFQVLAASASLLAGPWAAAAAIGSFQLAEGTLARWGGSSARARGLGLGGAGALLMVSALLYPPALMLYGVGLAVFALRPGGMSGDQERRAGLLASGLALGIVTAVAGYAVGVATAGRFIPQRAPALGPQLAHFQYPLVDALSLWRIWPSPVAALVVAVFIAIGLWCFMSGPPARRALGLTLMIASVPVAFLPNLFTVDGWGTFRTQVGITSLVIVYAFVALHGWFSLVRHRLREAAQTGAVVILALGAGFAAARNIVKYYASPQMTELRVMKSQLTRIDLEKVKRVWLAGTARDEGLTRARNDEFGAPSSSIPAAQGPMIWVITHEIRGHAPRFVIQVAPHPFRTKPNDYLVNMTQLDIFK